MFTRVHVSGEKKRGYEKWTPAEEEAFYSALKGVAGQKPEKCLREIVQRVGSKDYEQVGLDALWHMYERKIKCTAGLLMLVPVSMGPFSTWLWQPPGAGRECGRMHAWLACVPHAS